MLSSGRRRWVARWRVGFRLCRPLPVDDLQLWLERRCRVIAATAPSAGLYVLARTGHRVCLPHLRREIYLLLWIQGLVRKLNRAEGWLPAAASAGVLTGEALTGECSRTVRYPVPTKRPVVVS